MKFNKIALTILAVASFGLLAYADGGHGVDMFGVPRTIILASPSLISPGTATLTNGPIDTHGFDGIAVIDIVTLTNTPSSAVLTATIEQSVDSTNWTAGPSYAVATALSQNYTNSFYSTNDVVKQTTLYPGVITTPTAGTAGWATPYLAPALFTNTGALTVSQSTYYKIAYVVSDAARYVHVIWTPTGATNDVVGATFTGYRQQ
jgi:hypothetical protein